MYYNVTEKDPDGRSMASLKPGVKSPCCQVCGDESSGFHYGVDSCEGCKGFFRRCITQGMTHKCNNEEKCDITPFTRNSCQYCRLKKCFSVGMSREASRLGRRPKRLKDGESSKSSTNLPAILPYPSPSDLFKLKMAELQKLLQQNGNFKSDLMQAFLSAAQTSFREHSRSQQQQQQQQQQQISNQPIQNVQSNQNLLPPGNQQNMPGVESGYSSMSSPSSLKSVSPIHDNNQAANNNNIYSANQETVIKNEPVDNLTNQLDMNLINDSNLNFLDTDLITANNMNNAANFNIPTPTSATPSPGVPSVDGSLYCDSELRWDTLQSQLSVKSTDSNANDKNLDVTLQQVKTVASEPRLQLVKQITSQIIDAHLTTTINTYKNVNEANEKFEMRHGTRHPDTTTSESSTADEMWFQFKSNMVPEITKVVKFCKKIPGFSEIDQDDQIKLIKQGTFEVLLTRFCMLVDYQKGEMFDPGMSMKVPRSVVKAMPLGDFLEEFFNIAEAFNPLKLTDGEIGIFTAMLVFSPDREDLKNRVAITKIRHLFEQTLYQQIKTNHADPDDLFKSLLGTIPLFREVNSRHAHAITNMKIKNEEEFPDLHNEVFEPTRH